MRPPEDWRRARATLAIAAVTAVAWLLASYFGLQNFLVGWAGFVPARLEGLEAGGEGAPLFLTPLTATFVHAGFAHLLFNLIFLLICGRSVEPILGRPGFLAIYVLGAYAAAAGQWASSMGEAVPMVGASGAISAVIGAYAMLFGRNRVSIANPTIALWVNALWLAAAWVGLQLLIGFVTGAAGARIAIAAHIAGFLAGLVLARPLLLLRWRGA